jgi:hypothetical protein
MRNHFLRAAGKARLWTPALITTALWLDASDTSTVTASSGLISQVNDKSGNGRNFTASSGAQPTYTSSGLNGLPVFTFGGSQYLTSASTAATWNFMHNESGSSIWFVAKTGNSSNPLATYGYLGTNAAASANIGRSMYYADDAVDNDFIADFITRGSTFNPASNNYTTNALTPNVPVLISAIGDPANATASARSLIAINGNTPIQNNTYSNAPSASNATYTLQIGTVGNNAFPLVGYISELIITNATATTTTRQIIEGYLAWKWGLTANLPSGHPYKSAAPT